MQFERKNEKILVISLLLTLSTSAYPYVDPGTGSMLLQLLTGGAVGVMMIIKMYWQKISGFFRKKSK